MDGYVPDEIVDSGIDRNFMYIGKEKWDEELNYQKLDQFIKSNANSSKDSNSNTTHYDFSDTPHMSKAAKLLNKSGNVKGESLKKTLNELIVSFFNQNLKNQEIKVDYSTLAKKTQNRFNCRRIYL